MGIQRGGRYPLIFNVHRCLLLPYPNEEFTPLESCINTYTLCGRWVLLGTTFKESQINGLVILT